MNKNCPVCNKEIYNKPSVWKKLKGLATCSRTCRGEYLRQYYLGNKNPNSKYKTPIETYFANKTTNIRSSAKKRKLDCNISNNFLLNQFEKQNGLCYYTSIPLKLTSTRDDKFSGEDQADMDVLSVDRLDSSKGYLEENIVLCCNGINKMKGNVNTEGLKKFLEFITLQKNNCKIDCKKLTPDAILPQKNKLGDAGYDLFVNRVEDCGHYLKIYSGLALQPSVGWYLQMYPRSSIYKKNLWLANSVGVCDNLYTGEYTGIFLKTKDYNPEKDIFIKGDRFAQIVPTKYEVVTFVEGNSLFEEGRGNNGYGSSGR